MEIKAQPYNWPYDGELIPSKTDPLADCAPAETSVDPVGCKDAVPFVCSSVEKNLTERKKAPLSRCHFCLLST